MEITTMIGIVVAVIIILVGLRMLMRKSNDAAPSLESELHVNSDSNLPVIPRHVRHQLQPDVEPNAARVEPSLKPESVVDAPKETITVEATTAESVAVSSVALSENTDLNGTIAETTTGATAVESVAATVEMTQAEVMVDESQPKQAAPEFSPNSHVETAEIKAFDEESSILDVHLHEQQRFDDECSLANAESLIALNVYPHQRKALSGDKALKVLLKYGLRYGEMSCFHRYENIEEASPLMFSVLRLTDEGPAGFDLETLSGEQVQGLAFFLALPHADVQKGFDTMVSIAGLIAREIDGTVYDENNLEFTPQLKEHWRHKAIDFRSGQEV